MAASESGAPPGFDGGDWLALGHGLFGRDVRPPGTVAAPIVPVLTWGLNGLLGSRTAFVALQALCALAPGVGLYLVLRKRTIPGLAAALGALVLASAAAGEAAAWGGYPQLLGLGLIPLVVVAVDNAIRTRLRRSIVSAGALLVALALTSDFVFAYGLLASAVVAAFALTASGDRAALFDRVRAGVIMLVPLVLVVPLYAQLLSARVGAITDSTTASVTRTEPSVVARVDALWTDAPLLWRAIVLLGLFSVGAFFSRRGTQIWRVAVALLLPALAGLAFWNEPRLAYFLPMGLIVALALWSDELAPGLQRRIGALVLGVALAAQWVVFPGAAEEQTRRYRALTPELVDAIAWLTDNTAADDVVVVTPYRDSPPVGWWVEGLARRRTLSASSEEWVFFAQERRDAKQAARILSAGVPTPTTLAYVREAGASYVFIDKRWPEYATARVEALTAAVPGVLAFENGAAVILRAPEAS